EDDVFEMSQIASLKEQFWMEEEEKEREEKEETEKEEVSFPSSAHFEKTLDKKNSATPRGLERIISLIDAFIVRSDLSKAKLLLNEAQSEFGDHPEIIQRVKLLQSRSGSMMATSDEGPATPLKPLVSREKTLQQRKLEALEMMLRNIGEYRQL
ncbi:MAG: hypothetical protein ACXWRE_03445, partial [Pseudobdellovibrionaceae bacterium]